MTTPCTGLVGMLTRIEQRLDDLGPHWRCRPEQTPDAALPTPQPAEPTMNLLDPEIRSITEALEHRSAATRRRNAAPHSPWSQA